MNTSASLADSDLLAAFHGACATSPVHENVDTLFSRFSEPVMLDFLREGDANRLPEFGLSPKHVESIAGDDLLFERELRRTLLGEEFSQADEDMDRQTLTAIMRSEVRNLPYLQTILLSGHFLTVCPASGRALKSDASFIIDTHHVAYRFTGDVVFYLMVGRFHGRRAALCVPSRNVLVTLNVPERGSGISCWVAQLMRNLIKYSLVKPEQFKARLNSNTDELTLVTGGMENFGHHVWQELSGISHVLTIGKLSRIRSIIVGPHTWFRLDQVFPELAGVTQTKCSTAEEMLVNGLNQPGTIVRAVGVQITPDLRARLRRASAATLGSNELARIARAGEQSQLIWINLRAHNKMWKSQIEGYASLLNTLDEEHWNIGVVYDGWVDTVQIRDEIDCRLNPSIVRHDTLGAPIETSLAWAEAVTAYVSVVGSGLVLNSWLVNKPGIAHANRAHLRQSNFWNSVSEGTTPTNFIESADVSCDGTLYGNYDFDWRILLPQTRHALGLRGKREF